MRKRLLRPLPRFLPALLLTLLLGAGIGACGSADDEGNAEGPRVVETPGIVGAAGPAGLPPARGFDVGTADQEVGIIAGTQSAPLAFDQAVYTANAGDVTFEVTNNSGTTQHQFTIRGNGVHAQSGQFNSGFTGEYTLRNLQPGEYEILCQFHEQVGMRATLIVK